MAKFQIVMMVAYISKYHRWRKTGKVGRLAGWRVY